jgi:hypothetical protein
MLILNFTHPLTEEQLEQIKRLTGQDIEEVRQIGVHFDNDKPFAEQVEKLVKDCDLSPQEWQSRPILIVPPAFNFIAVTLFAALHGVMGYFPPIVRLKPVHGSTPPRFEVAEIINLQEIREFFRTLRY